MTLVPDQTEDETPAAPPPVRARRGSDPLGPDGHIGASLRALYAEVESEPIPTQLIELLEQLSEAERKAGK